MKPLKIIVSITLRCFVLLLLLTATAYFAFKNYWFSVTFLLSLVIMSLGELIYLVRLHLLYYQKIIVSLLHDDFSLDLNESQFKSNDETLKLYKKIKAEKQLNDSKEILYHQLLNATSSGFLILKRTEDDRKIIFMNKHFQSIFNIPKSTSWKYLKKFIPKFCETFEESDFQEIKSTFTIEIQGEERQTYIIQNSKTAIANQTYDIIILDSIQRVIDSTEKEAWMNVMKVIAHEIINSLTPIASLASTTKLYFETNELTNDDYDDIRLSLDTIINRSIHLQKFVDQYRQLTMLPDPVKTKVNIQKLIREVHHAFRHELEEKNINFVYDTSQVTIVNADRVQLEQVVINLLKNAIFSVARENIRVIRVDIKQQTNRLQIIFEDSGTFIDDAIVSKIFLPFYTTRKNGVGIGLTLSKNIVEAHNGYLYYKQSNNKKQFVIVFKS